MSNQKIRTYLILTLVPYPYGGGESFMHQTIPWLQRKDSRCVWVAFSRQTTKRTTICSEDGCIFHTYGEYPTVERFEEIYSIYQPDIIHLQGPIVYLAVPFFKKYRVPLLVGFHFWTGIIKPNDQGGFDNKDILANSHHLILDSLCQEQTSYMEFYVASDFMNEVIQALGGQQISNIIYPIPPPEHYLVERKDSWYITIININHGKGGDIFLEIVKAIKDLPFLAICNEPNVGIYNSGSQRYLNSLDDEIVREINGEVLTYTDVKEVYAKTKILLIPSHVDETFSRVAYEGAANGIPILTSGKGFVKQLLGNAGIYLSENPQDWIDAIRQLYHRDDLLAERSKMLKEQVFKLGDQQLKFNPLIDNLLLLSPKRNIMIFAPWCDQGLGVQAKLYSELLRGEGYKVHIFSFLSYFCLDQLDKFQQDPKEWQEYDTIYESYNTREEVTERELRQFVISRNIGLCLIPEICFPPIFEKVKILKKYHVRCYAIPNIETCRKDELGKYSLFEKILCPTRQCYNILKKEGVTNLEYIGHCLPLHRDPQVIPETPTKFLHVSGYNALTRKQTLLVLKAFREAQSIVGKKIELTVTFSKNIPGSIFAYDGDGISLITRTLSHQEILDFYTEHHVSIQVASHEGLGLGFYESLACGTPVISLDQAPHNEVILEGKSGWLIPSREFDLSDNNQSLVKGGTFNPKDLTAKIVYLACYSKKISKVKEACFKEQKKWSREAFMKRLITAFEA